MDNQTDNVTNIDVFGISPYAIESSGGLRNTITGVCTSLRLKADSYIFGLR